MRLLATVWFWVLVATTLPIFYVIATLLLLLAPVDPHRRIATRWVTFSCHQYLRACWPFWRVTVEGREHLPKGACVLIANHQSMADILALMGLGYGFKFVSKASLFGVPFIGWMMRQLKYVAIERGRMPSMQQMMETSEQLLRAGEPVLIFPEGTYSSGVERLRFKRGAFKLAAICQVPVVPVVVKGTSELVFEDGPMFAPSSHVRVIVMPPVPAPAIDDDGDALARQLEQAYEQWLGQSFRPLPGATKP